MDSSVPRDEESPLLVANQLSDEAHRKHSRDVHILSCGFLLIFLAYGAAQNLESSVNTVSSSSIVVPNLTLLHGTYLTSTAWSYSKVSNLHEGTVIGSFNGEFWGMVASHQFIGNLISLAILQDDGEAAFAQSKVWQSGAVASVFFLSPYISLQAMLVTMLAAGSLIFCILVSYT
ncbi:hypothetical protein CRG98_040262 [Punica granatum]|uniref:Uncharacterized protein n=1 Tax=Punica granatum TaxID=22663 RepID=A0A2I0I7L0_PUNGR|nr:hypothetical protein CRG98_040262 [Punica granatum]